MKSLAKNILVAVLTFIAKAILWRHEPRVVAVTGSVGKTSTKDAIYTVLKGTGSVRRSEKSFNSELGVPLSIIGAASGWNRAHAWLGVIARGLAQVLAPRGSYPATLVLEVGADRPGDISRIAKWIRPHVVVITRLPDVPVHIEFFPTLDSLIQEKLSLARHMRRDGTLVLNADDPRVLAAREEMRVRTITYGTDERAMIRASDVKLLPPSEDGREGGLAFKANFDGKSLPVILPNIYGESYMSIALAALGVAYALGHNMVTAIGDLAQYETPPGRARLIAGARGTVLIDDTYNSSPAACEAGLKMLKELPFGNKKIAVIADMLELGRHTNEAHRQIGAFARSHADILVAVGLRARGCAEAAREAGMSEKKIYEADDALGAVAIIETVAKPGDVIYVKGSQGMRMERAVKALMAEPERAKELLVRQEEAWSRR